MKIRSIILFLFLISITCSVQLFAKTSDSTTLNRERWDELSRSLDYTEKQQAEKKEVSRSFDVKPPKLPINSEVLKLILFIAIIFFIIFILYKLEVFSLIRSYLTKKETIHEDDEQDEQAPLTPSQELFNQALTEKDRKTSLRLLYLACLHYLAEADIIKIRKETTSSSYIRALSGRSIQKDFRNIVHVHELTWFGDKEITETEYNSAVDRARHIFTSNQMR